MGTFTGQVTLYVLPTHHTASTAALAHLFWTQTIPSLGLTIMLHATVRKLVKLQFELSVRLSSQP